ncbi:MAG: CBS and ACT domain-containing protein [Anaerolineae bacterium]|nr:CBS and ACT domain-containing protein [Anaerolineae bacterium]
MFVRDCMTTNPITVRPESDPLAALALLKCGRFRRLPVVDALGKPVGIITRPDLEVFLAKASSSGIARRQYRVDQVMKQQVVTVQPDCPLEEAADLMVRNKVSSLLVVEGERLVGIITETDIFRQFAAVLGGGTASLRITVQVFNIPGQLAELAGRIASVGGNITSIVAYRSNSPERTNITLRVEGSDRDTLVERLRGQHGLEILHIWDGPACASPQPYHHGR